ncbi:6-bladed beta-propeller [Puteibacter caeruleilacunae]|nr:6-bladed beta-propeller [Puteibacter caeruleilacunae]
MKQCIYMIFGALLLFSCITPVSKENVQNKSLPSIKITYPDRDKLEDLFLSEIADSIRYIPLETRSKCLLTGVLTAAVSDKYFFIKQRYKLFQFSKEGKFIRQVGNEGRGPGEFLLRKFIINKSSIFLFPRKARFLEYDFNGNHIRTIKNNLISSDIEDMTSTNDCIVFCNAVRGDFIADAQKKDELVLYDPLQGKDIRKLKINYGIQKKKGTGHQKITGMQLLARNKESAYYKYIFNDTLYQVNKDGIVPKFILDFGKHQYSIDNAYTRGGKNLNKKLRDVITIASMTAFNNHFILSCTYHDDNDKLHPFICTLNINSLEVRYCKPFIINDIDGGPDVPGFMMENGIFPIEAGSLKNDSRYYHKRFPKEEDYYKKNFKFYTLFDTISENANPIIQRLFYNDTF